MGKGFDWDEVLDRAKTGKIVQHEVDWAIQALSRQYNRYWENLYTILYIVGLASSPEKSGALVRWHLLHDEDPMMVGLALRILGKWWSRASDWSDTIQAFLDWQEWDEDEDARRVACMVASDYLSTETDAPVLRSLMNVAQGVNADKDMRKYAASCLAGALGYSHRQLAGLDGEDNRPTKQQIFNEANKRLAQEKSSGW